MINCSSGIFTVSMSEEDDILPSSASTQFNSISTSIEAELVLFPFDPATHPPAGKVSIETGDESNQKGLIQDHLVTFSS